MRPVLYVLSFIAVMGMAFWAYRENYATQHQLKEMGRLQDEIASLREALILQRAEWAYLNRPERLRNLATANFDRLGLLPLEAAQFGAAAEVSYPVTEPLAEAGAGTVEVGLDGLPVITDPVEVSGLIASVAGEGAAKPEDKEFP